MICPGCGSGSTICKDTRQRKRQRYRRYVCQACGRRFSTFERYVDEDQDKQEIARLRETIRGAARILEEAIRVRHRARGGEETPTAQCAHWAPPPEGEARETDTAVNGRAMLGPTVCKDGKEETYDF